MKKKKLKRTRSQKQAKDFQQRVQQEEEEEQQLLQSPKMVEQEQLSEPVQQDQIAENKNTESMEEDQPSETPQYQNLEDQNPKLVEEQEEVQNPKLVLVEEEPPPSPQDQRHDEDGTHDLENQPREAQGPEEIHDLENQSEEAKAHVEGEKVDEEGLLQPKHEQGQEQGREEEEHQQKLHQQDGDEPVGMALSSALPPPSPAPGIIVPDILPDNTPHNAQNVSRKPPKRKKPLTQRQLAALEKKLQAVREKLQPIPFIPSKTLDFSKHEILLKRLGLWDFAHLEFDLEIRTDFLAQLIVNFNPQLRCSYVNDFRIMVNRADLGRALKLPLKKDKINLSESADLDIEKLPEDFVPFMEDFVSTWFFLHEDSWILPNEIVAWCKLIRDGHPEKVDWPGLIWFMVEKELTQSQPLGSCYYASHLQRLIKGQHAHLFKEEPTTEGYMEEEEDADTKKTNLEDLQGDETESQPIELSLGHVKTDCEQVRDEDDVMEFQDCKDGEPGLWRLDEEELQQHQPHHEEEQQREEEQQQQQLHQEEDVEPLGMTLSPTLPPPPAHEITLLSIHPDNIPHNAPNVYVSRRPPKKKKPLNQGQLAALEKKLQVVRENLRPIPFVPGKTLDFSKHEKLLKHLGLWDFSLLELDREIRTDLLAQLIVNYNPQLRCSYVNDFRIMVNRADLGRALKLPLKKDKINLSEFAEFESEKFPEDFVAFMEDFVSTLFFLHEDTWILPNEIVEWCKLIRDGHPEKVDWPGLIWFMVEKELTQSQSSGFCYYASHLQRLIMVQHADLFKEEPRTEVYMKEEEDADIKESNLEDFQGKEMESHPIELSLGHVKTHCEQVRDEADVMDFQDCKDDEPGLWRLDGRNSVGEHFLQPCNLNKLGGLESEHERKEVEEEERYDLSSKPTSLERLSSTELMQAVGTANISFNTPAHLFSHSSGELLTSRLDSHMNSVGPSAFGNGCNRELDHDDDVNHHSFNQHKRMRSDGPWDQKASDFDLCMEQVQSWMGKARLMYEAKEQEMLNSHLHQQALISELQQREKIIEALHRSKSEGEQKGRLEIYRLEHELYVMSNLLNGYKEALKETRRAFSVYRQRHPQPDEPLYKDVAGPGGIVLSSMELEKQRKEREEERKVQCLMIEGQMRDFEQMWLGKLELHLKEVHFLSGRLFDLENGTNLLKESFVKREVSET